MGRLSVGQKLITFYFLTAYGAPLLGNAIFGTYISSSYKMIPPDFSSTMYLVATYCAFLWASRSFNFEKVGRLSIQLQSKFAKLRAVYSYERIWFAALVFTIGIVFFLQSLSTYRYSSVPISQQNSSMLLIGTFFVPIVFADLFYAMFVTRLDRMRLFSRYWFGTVIFSFSLILLVDGTVSMFLCSFTIFFSLFPSYFRRLFFVPAQAEVKQLMSRFLQLASITALLLTLSWSYGESIKRQAGTAPQSAGSLPLQTSSSVVVTENHMPKEAKKTYFSRLIKINDSKAKERRQDFIKRLKSIPSKLEYWAGRIGRAGEGEDAAAVQPPSENSRVEVHEVGDRFSERYNVFLEKLASVKPADFFLYLTERLSIYYYSFLFTNHTPFLNLTDLDGEYALIVPIRTFFFRLDYVLGGLIGIERPEVSSVCHLNYFLLTKEPTSSREGSCPGLLASFDYVLPFPANFLFCVAYLCVLSAGLNALLKKNDGTTLSFFGLVIVSTMLQNLFQSPFDYVLVFDAGFIGFAAFAAITVARWQERER